MGQSQLAFFCLVRRRFGAGGKGRRPSKWNNHGGLCEQAAFLRVTCGGRGGLGVRPRFQRFHDSTLGNGLHEIVLSAFRGNRWGRGNRDFVAFVGNVGMRGNRAFVGIVGTAQKKFAKSDQKSRAKGHTAAPAGGVVSWSRQKQTGRQGPRKGWLYDR